MNVKQKIPVLVALTVLALAGGCKAATSAATAAAGGTDSGDSSGSSGGSSGGNSSATPSPTPQGMYCTDYNGWDYLASYPIFSNTTVTGSTVNSVTMQFHYGPTSGTTAITGTYTTSLTLTAYTCGSSSSTGSSAGTATASVGVGNSDKTFTFTFSSPIAIPSSGACGSNPYPLVFKLTQNSGNPSGYQLLGQSTLTSTTCATPQSSSTSVVVPRVRAWTAIISGSP